MSDAIPGAVDALLDPDLPRELVRKVDAEGATYYVVRQAGEAEGGVVVVRQAPGSAPEVVVFDTVVAAPDAAALPRGVAGELEALGVVAAPEADEEAFEAFDEAARPLATREQVRGRMFDRARGQVHKLDSSKAPGTDGGNLACAWAVNRIASMALGREVGGGLSTTKMHGVLKGRHFRIEEGEAKGGAVIISPTDPAKRGHGHVGVMGDGGKIYSNSSKRARWEQNYSLRSWKERFAGKLEIAFFDLNPAHFPGGDGHPPYPGTPLKRGSRGDHVRTVQRRLNALGRRLEADGDFGPATHAAVVGFQRERGLEADGIVGPRTWAALWK